MGNNLYTTVAEADARLVSERGDVLVAGDILTREWPLIDATYADGLMAALLLTKTVTGPLADSQTFTGTFAVSDVFSLSATSCLADPPFSIGVSFWDCRWLRPKEAWIWTREQSRFDSIDRYRFWVSKRPAPVEKTMLLEDW